MWDAARTAACISEVATVVALFLRRLNGRIKGLAGFEARGITRVQPDERQTPYLAADFQIAILWFSANISANNLTTGLFGPLVFQLGFKDSAIYAIFRGILGSLPYLLNIVLIVSYTTLNLIITRQILSALPQLLVLFVVIGSAGSHFDASLESADDGVTLAANRLSFPCFAYTRRTLGHTMLAEERKMSRLSPARH
ncbi:hypothetical protein B0T24DRAFT_592551 [Lasiosphaeria ovina]|uniref:Uncharacterized protein n=1 Tax=Lasiosphaeria ovina TaxID=92902 RepID=A0AAE0KJ43_9PEZI|nr:hypothetical protein B0T24DRAFT_592551 [Lasiosphaeria ovina]